MAESKFNLAYLNDEGEWTTLMTYTNYERADRAHDHLSELYPHALIEINPS